MRYIQSYVASIVCTFSLYCAIHLLGSLVHGDKAFHWVDIWVYNCNAVKINCLNLKFNSQLPTIALLSFISLLRIEVILLHGRVWKSKGQHFTKAQMS